jgi:mannose/fructose/N-acetylgalactosamine-specific phosphotransferase system component IID
MFGEQRPTMPAGVRYRLWWRCLGLQAAWNSQRMQNLGLLAALAPWARWRRIDRDECRQLARRYLGFFNTNPYLAPYVVGGLVRLEDERQQGRDVPDSVVTGFRDSLSRACGAIGDELFWLGLRPAFLLLALVLGWIGSWPLALAAVALFALAQLHLRWRGLELGYRLGPSVISVLARPGWHRAVAWSRRLALGLTGFLAGCYFAGGLARDVTPGTGQLVGLVLFGLLIPVIPLRRQTGEIQLWLGFLAMAGWVLLF